MRKTLLLIIFVLLFLSSVSAYPVVINRFGTEGSVYNDLISRVPSEYLERLDAIEIVNEYKSCGAFRYSYYFPLRLYYSKIILSNELGCVNFIINNRSPGFVLWHEIGHLDYVRDYKVVASEVEADGFSEGFRGVYFE